MNLVTIAEHTIDNSRLGNGTILDLGYRDGVWSKAIDRLGDYHSCGVDADPGSTAPYHYAISATDRQLITFIVHGNGTGNYIDDGRPYPAQYTPHTVETRRIDTLVKELFDRDCIDLIKIDIEGAEIEALIALKEPPAKSLSIEFHMHTGTPGFEVLAVFAHLASLGYEHVHSDYSEKHGCGFNYWDELFILK